MSKTLHLWDEISAICKAAGLEPTSVAEIRITPAVVTFEVYVEPKQVSADGPLMVTVTHPWTREPE
jgi:hypothetical protein